MCICLPNVKFLCITMCQASVLNMKFLCLNLLLGEVCTDNTDAANANNANDDARRTKHDFIRLFGS